jgi:hypothetical protein
MELLDLYKEENKNLLYSISWLNKNSTFDKSIGDFVDIDLFTFLENINSFDYKKDIYFDDIYYILLYTEDTIIHLINNINKEIRREHKILPISQAKEFDNKSILWISRQNGRTLKEKLSDGKIKAVQRYENIDTYENRIFKKLLKKLLKIYEVRDDLVRFDNLFLKIRKWLRSDDAKTIDEHKKIIYNNLLLHHHHYSKIFKSFKKINSLNDKLTNYDIRLKNIIRFEILFQLQYFTKVYLLPVALKEENNFYIEQEKSLINLSIDNLLERINTNKIKNNLNFASIRKFSKYLILNELELQENIDRTFKIENKSKQIFIDIFRLFPIVRINNETIKFPIILKQKVNGKIVNANNTKVINLNNEIHTLPEILDTFDTSILKHFLDDFSRYFKESRLNYIMPDYVNVFEFTQSKKMINSYFKYNKPIPKSILTGLKLIFEKNVKKDDTLIYIQRDHTNQLFVTPLLVKYDQKLDEITNGFYLERYPTKKINDVNNEMMNSLNEIFKPEISTKLLNKFLQNGLKGIKEENIVFYQDDKIIDLAKFEIPKNKYTKINQIRNLYTTTNLFKKNSIFINDNNEENLINFEKLLKYENKGYNLWREHLPDLSMEIFENGLYEQFILVNKTSRLIEKTINIYNHFLIPMGEKELSFPLTFGDEKINYKAYLSSKDFPYKQNIECKLNLTYDYERENPYELIFEPINNSLNNIDVQWRKVTFENVILPIPNYPEEKSWNDLENFISKDGVSKNLLHWLAKDLEKIIQIHNYLLRPNREKATLTNNWEVDVNNKKFQEILTSEGTSRIYYYNNLDRVNEISFNLEKRGNFIKATNIVTNQEHFRLLKSYRFPLTTIFNNGKTLMDMDVPNEFRILIDKAINSALSIYSSTDDKNLKDEMFYFLSCLHSNAPSKIGDILLEHSDTNYSCDKYSNNLGYSIGYLELKWQKEIYRNIIKFLKSNKEEEFSTALQILSIIAWRYDKFILEMPDDICILISEKLYESLRIIINEERSCFENKLKYSILIRLELLLALLRYRNISNGFLMPSKELTIKYVKIIDILTNKLLENNIQLNSRITLDINKPNSFLKTPDLLYALRVYLTADTGAANSIKVLGVSDD